MRLESSLTALTQAAVGGGGPAWETTARLSTGPLLGQSPLHGFKSALDPESFPPTLSPSARQHFHLDSVQPPPPAVHLS